MGFAVSVPVLSANGQIVRRSDHSAFVDQMKCSQPHRYDITKRSGAGGGTLIPPSDGSTPDRYIVRASPAATAELWSNPATDGRIEAMGQVRFDLTTMDACADAWSIHGDLVASSGSAFGGTLKANTSAVPFGRRGDNNSEAIGGLLAYAGASTSSHSAYDPALGLTRAAWLGGTMRLDIPTQIWLGPLGWNDIVIHSYWSAQGDYALDKTVRDVRASDIAPRWSLSLPITALRAFNIPGTEIIIVGVGYTIDRADNFTTAGSLQRQTVGLVLSTFGKQADVTIHGDWESLGSSQLYRGIGISVKIVNCSICQHSF